MTNPNDSKVNAKDDLQSDIEEKDVTVGAESNMRELTEKETEEAAGGNPIGVGAFVVLTGIEVGQLIDERAHSERNPDAQENASDDIASSDAGFGSDIRIKQDIEKVGFDPSNRVDLYSWRYKSEDKTRYVGVMAQDLLRRADLAKNVGVAIDGQFKGFFAVAYDKMGLKMTTEDNFRKQGIVSVLAS